MNFVLPNLEAANKRKKQQARRNQIILWGFTALVVVIVVPILVFFIQSAIYGNYRPITDAERQVLVTKEDILRQLDHEVDPAIASGEEYYARDEEDGSVALEYHFWRDKDEEESAFDRCHYWCRIYLYKTEEEAKEAFPKRRAELEDMLKWHPDLHPPRFTDLQIRYGDLNEDEQINCQFLAQYDALSLGNYNAIRKGREIYLQVDAFDGFHSFGEWDMVTMLEPKIPLAEALPR